LSKKIQKNISFCCFLGILYQINLNLRMWFFSWSGRLPFWFLYGVSDLIFGLIYYVIRYRRKLVLQNLTDSFPEKSPNEIKGIAKQFYRQFADTIVETPKLFHLSPEALRQRVTIENKEVILRHFAAGHYILTFGSHLGNWEWIGPGLAAHGIPSDAVYKPLSSPFFEQLMYRLRSIKGVNPVPMQRIMRDLVTRRNEPRIVGLATDQSPHEPQHAIWLPFLNHPNTAFFPGTEKLARSTQKPVMFGEFRRIKRGYYAAYFHEIAEPPHNHLPSDFLTQRYSELLEAAIRKQPADWLWSHNRWKHVRK
jgi:Kdo2-lipid IVA lauroyltransferase/acyltransferase